MVNRNELIYDGILTDRAVAAVRAATNLEQLLGALQMPDPMDGVRWASLPSFETAPRQLLDTHSVWSSDDTRLLVGTCADDLAIVSRRRWERDCEQCGEHGTGLCPECAELTEDRSAYVSSRSCWIDREDGRGMVQVPEREYTEWSGFREIRIVS